MVAASIRQIISPEAAPNADDATLARPAYAEMMVRYLGPVVAAALADDDVTEIYVNPSDGRVRLDRRSQGPTDTGCELARSRIELFLNAVAARGGHIVGAETPHLEAELPRQHFRGSRLQGFVEPLVSGPCFTIRKPPTVVYSLDELVRQGVLFNAHRAAIRQAVIDRRNVLVVGGTNSGKTTFCNAVIREISDLCPMDRIVVLEDTVELQCIAPDHLALRTAPGLSLAQLVKSALRASPKRIVVGEVRDHAALDLLDAWATGHPGGCATLHATTAAGALARLDRLAQRANVPSQLPLIAEAIHLVVVMRASTSVDGENGPPPAPSLMPNDSRRDLASTGSCRRVVDLVRVGALTANNDFTLERCTGNGTWTSTESSGER